jgi:putative phosphoesterase
MPGQSKTRKIALLGDVHGNLPALEAVLEDAARQAADEVWNLGDFLGYAPFPNEVAQRLREAGAVSIIGNYDLKVLAFQQQQARWKHKKTPEKYVAFEWNDEHLSGRTRAFLESLPQQLRLEIDGATVLLVHGSPAAIDEPLGSGTPQGRFVELARRAAADVVVCGHSHEAFARREGDTWFVNPGSVGRPEGGDWRASYALLEFAGGEWKVEHRRITYDVDRVARAVRAAGLPESFVDVFRQAQSLDQLQGKASRGRIGNTLDAVLALARSCRYEQEHTHQVTRLALEVFDQLQDLHGMGPQERLWLQYGALLHDIGWIEGQSEHHKTALRLIMAEPSLPFEHRERTIVGLIARYHRKALPDRRHKYFGALSRADQDRVRVLAGILRVADGLDCSHQSVVQSVHGEVSAAEIVLSCETKGPVDCELAAAEKKADLLGSVFGRPCTIRVSVKTG